MRELLFVAGKQQSHEIVQPSGQAIPQHKTSYSFAYSYDGSQPHAPTHIDDRTYTYDANGNQLGWTHDQNGTRRTIVWDEENRIQSLFDNGHEKTYKYDDAGQRVIKRGPQGETAYVNQYFTIRNREVGTKHVFVGSTRLVSKLMKQDKPGGNPKGNPPLEKDQYFFHPDHLGSTNYVSDSNGQLYEHLEYFPFGETWVDESSNTQRTPYLFTSKELDEETGLYYYGARYYDPRTNVWQSPDVAMERYLNGLSMGGIYNSGNLNLYAYGYQNPVKYTDPNGQWLETAWDAFNIGLGVASLVDNVRQGNYLSAAVDAVGVVADTAAAIVPVVPGGVGSAIKAARAADKGIDALKAADKVSDVARSTDKAVDAAKGADKASDVARSTDKAADAASGGSFFRAKTGYGGRLESIQARVGPKDIGSGTATNKSSRNLAQRLGREGDDAGHGLGSNLGGKGGAKSTNIFPQDPGINRGVYQKYEAEVVDNIRQTGQHVDIKQSFIYRTPTDTRPIGVTYEVLRNGEYVLPPRTFLNP